MLLFNIVTWCGLTNHSTASLAFTIRKTNPFSVWIWLREASTLVIMCLLKCIFIAFYVINDEINVHWLRKEDYRSLIYSDLSSLLRKSARPRTNIMTWWQRWSTKFTRFAVWYGKQLSPTFHEEQRTGITPFSKPVGTTEIRCNQKKWAKIYSAICFM
jgi:hypothetical protein